jgi:hypothetical protein
VTGSAQRSRGPALKLQGKILLFLAGAIVALTLAHGWIAYSQLRGSLEQQTFRQMTTLL